MTVVKYLPQLPCSGMGCDPKAAISLITSSSGALTEWNKTSESSINAWFVTSVQPHLYQKW